MEDERKLAAGQSGIILAGGRSARMGRNKALLPVDGKPLLRRLAERMLALGMTRVIVACGTEARGAEYRARLRELPGDLAFAVDRFPGSGPLAGLHAALGAMPEPGYAFAMACDMPAISASLYARMLRAAGEGGRFDEAAGRSDNGGASRTDAGESPASSPDSARLPQLIRTAGQPFHALYHTSAREELERRLRQHDLRVMPLLGALRSIELSAEPDEEEAFVNLNTPELYERFLRLRGDYDGLRQ
ncbi:molybdenum cofactor guanylyltransferase [Paenibacillus glycinis]|uniref:Probable molybdenum cofactor guanylyltransferase n=1 Tax=Paenibacillus glycinis TaxID=2697035 RepID=A0ABW9XX60_9BACL|nr:molybdenum cofactor guanylyltransferase [Paenibacillus glycinis]NBD26832.1 NTP transferase domain-containing protein [Paenibacillus glycinis]